MANTENLLKEYARSGSESAFREFVEQNMPLVYGTALRIGNGDRHFAEDISQIVFTELAKRACEVSGQELLSGWIYRHTFFTACKAVRTERRRSFREQKAMEQNENSSPRVDREEIEAALDPALNELSPQERFVLVLRFFQKADFRRVGEILGTSEDAAQKRVSRALEKLRDILSARGLSLTIPALSAVLEPVAAPVGLATKLAGLAVAAASGGGALVSFWGGTKMKAALAGGILLGVSIPIVLQQIALGRAAEQNRGLQEALAEMQAEREEETGKNLALSTEIARLRTENLQVQRLRGEVTQLRQQAKTSGLETNKETKEELVLEEKSEPALVMIEGKFIEITPEQLQELRTSGIPIPTGDFAAELSPEQMETALKYFSETAGATLLAAPKVTTLEGRQAQISVTKSHQVNGQEFMTGPIISALPKVSPDRSGITLEVQATVTEFMGVVEQDGVDIPRVRTRAAESQKTINLNSGLLLLATVKNSLPVGDAGEKIVLVLVTPTLMNRDGSVANP